MRQLDPHRSIRKPKQFYDKTKSLGEKAGPKIRKQKPTLGRRKDVARLSKEKKVQNKHDQVISSRTKKHQNDRKTQRKKETVAQYVTLKKPAKTITAHRTVAIVSPSQKVRRREKCPQVERSSNKTNLKSHRSNTFLRRFRQRRHLKQFLLRWLLAPDKTKTKRTPIHNL